MTPATSDWRATDRSPHAPDTASRFALLAWLLIALLMASPALAQPAAEAPQNEAFAQTPAPEPAQPDEGEEEEEEGDEEEGDEEEGDDDAEEGDDDAEEGDDDAEEGDDEEGDDDAEEGDDEEGDDDAEEGDDEEGDDEEADDAEEGDDEEADDAEETDEGDDEAEEAAELAPAEETVDPAPAEEAVDPAPAEETVDPATQPDWEKIRNRLEPGSDIDGEAAEEEIPPENRTAVEEPEVVEGELGNIGGVGLVPWKNRFGIIVGIERIGEIFYGAARPEINYTRKVDGKDLSMSFGIPVRFELLDNRLETKWENIGAFRNQDWDEVSDYAQVLRFLRFGGKESRFFLDVNSFTANTIGHGVLLKRYNPNLNLNTTQVSLQLDAFGDYIGGETYLNNITGPSVMGALVFLKPLSFIDRDNFFLRSFSLGFTLVGDIDAPMRNRLDLYDVDDDGRRLTEIEVNQDTFQPEYYGIGVVGYGIDLEFKLVDKRELDWKMYFDQSYLETGVPLDAAPKADGSPYTAAIRGGGFTWGNLFRMNLGKKTVHALRFRTEYRNYDPNYLPSYFDTLYEIQRVQYFNGLHARERDLENDTKLQRVLGRSIEEERIQGVYLEGSWRVGNALALSFGIEYNDRTPDNSLYLHAEVPRIGNWSFMASYQHRGAKDFGDIFNLTLSDTDVLLMKTRYGLFDSVHMNLEVLTPFGIGPESLFRNDLQVNLNAEIGFEYL